MAQAPADGDPRLRRLSSQQRPRDLIQPLIDGCPTAAPDWVFTIQPAFVSAESQSDDGGYFYRKGSMFVAAP